MTLNNLMIDKRIVQRNIEQGKLEPAEYQRILDALPDLSDKVWRRPAVAETTHAEVPHVEAAQAGPAATAPASLDAVSNADAVASAPREVVPAFDASL
jgi:hypothetical protein